MNDNSPPNVSQSTQAHRDAAAQSIQTIPCAVLTISDTRTLADDRGGQTIVDALEQAGHTIVQRAIVRDDASAIHETLQAWLQPQSNHPSSNSASQPAVICTTGGTGISSRDTTIEVVDRLYNQRLDGFGELFRMLSWDQVGPAAMLSRASAGLIGETLLFAMPGSTNAVSLAMEKLIVPELPHLVWERRRPTPHSPPNTTFRPHQ